MLLQQFLRHLPSPLQFTKCRRILSGFAVSRSRLANGKVLSKRGRRSTSIRDTRCSGHVSLLKRVLRLVLCDPTGGFGGD